MIGRGFQTVQGGIAPGTERSVAGLAEKGLDAFAMAVLAIANESVDMGIGDPAIRVVLVGTSKAFGVHAGGGLLDGF